MQEFINILNNAVSSESFFRLVVSDPVKGADYNKIIIERKKTAKRVFIQFEIFKDKQVFHENSDNEQAITKIAELLMIYRQWDCTLPGETFKALVSNGKCRILNKTKINKDNDIKPHDIKKNYILDIKEPWLQTLAINQKKFRQINKFLETVKSVEDKIPDNAYIVDFGCGKAYLTFALYDYITKTLKKRVRITGIDIKKDMAELCAEKAKEAGFNGLSFMHGEISEFNTENKIDTAICLHACDTATDHALAKAVAGGAEVILCVPCCQHELYTQISTGTALKPLLSYGILKERFASLLTDTVRALLLENAGYSVTVLEFTDPESTLKNIMIKAVKGNSQKAKEQALKDYKAVCDEYSLNPTLGKLLGCDLNG